MLRCLFWNINRKPLVAPLRSLCDSLDIDVLILAECTIAGTVLLQGLNNRGLRTFIRADELSERIIFLHRLPPAAVRPVSDFPYCSIRAIEPPGHDEILIAAIHHMSKLHADDYDQTSAMNETAENIRAAEDKQEHKRTIVVGDFNMNPFELSVCSADGLHAVMCKQIAAKRDRIVRGLPRDFFYNPMWNFLGDETPGPPGTYYYRGATVSYFWNTFDQVLFRPELLPYYKHENIRVIDELDGVSLLGANGLASQFFQITYPFSLASSQEDIEMNVSAHAPDSLWGEIPEVSEIDSVKFVLEEQALALKRNTKGLLYGIVQMKTREGRFIVSLSIVAPSLDNYTQQILSVTHGIDSFPATINNSPDWPATECSDITEFKEAVGERLQSERVRKLIRGLLGMMRPAPDFEKPFA